MNESFVEFVGWVFALVYVGATLLRLTYILLKRDPGQVIATYWALMGVANICLYLYVGKFGAPQTIVGLLGTAVLDFVIAGVTISQRREQKTLAEEDPLQTEDETA